MPQASGSRVALSGGNSFATGIYTGAGAALTKIVDLDTNQPGSSFQFSSLGTNYFKISGNTVAFTGGGTGAGFGLYTGGGGTLTRVIDTNTVVPGTSFTFDSLNATTFTQSGSTVAFSAGWGTSFGLFTGSGGTPTRVVSTATTVPGTTATFSTLGTTPAYAGSAVAFYGGNNFRKGIYNGTGGALTTVADTTTTVPGTSSSFTDFVNLPSISGSVTAFQGNGGGRIGVYRGSGGAITRIADSTTLVPGSSLAFTSFGPVKNLDTTVYFAGGNSSTSGIYIGSGGSLQKIIALGDSLDGSTVTALQQTFSLSDTFLTFEANLQNGTVGVYAYPVPEPQHVLAACAACLFVLGVFRNRGLFEPAVGATAATTPAARCT